MRTVNMYLKSRCQKSKFRCQKSKILTKVKRPKSELVQILALYCTYLETEQLLSVVCIRSALFQF